MKVEVGTRLRLHTAQGRKIVETVGGVDTIVFDLGEEAGHLPADSVGTVVAIDDGAHFGTPHATIQFGPTEHGAPGQRHWSYPVESLGDVFEATEAKTPHRYGTPVKEIK